MAHPASTTIAKPPLADKSSAKGGLASRSVAGCVFTLEPPSWATVKKPNLPNNAPTAGYLCGGAGIMSAGFEAAGIRSLWNIDRDPSDVKLSNAIADIYERNFSSKVIRQILQEIAKRGFAGLERPDILVLTQSCKNLSKSNPKQKETDLDVDVAKSAAKAIQHFLPQIFIVENVPEYVGSQSWEIVGNTLEQLGYSITSGVVNAADYGVAQDRRRFVAIATLNAPAIPLPKPTGIKTGWLEAVIDLLKDAETVYPTEKQLAKIERLSACILSEPLLIERVAPWGLPNVKSPIAPCWTIRKSIWLDQRHCSRDNAINIRLPNGNWINLGVRGAARLCSVPDWFQLPDEAWSAGSAIGNGVPCLLGQAIAQALTCQFAETIKPFIVQISEIDLTALNLQKNLNHLTTTEDKAMTVTTENLVANTVVVETVVTSVAPKTRKVKQPKVRNQHLLENPEIEAAAASVVTSSFATIKSSLLGMVEEGRKLIDLKISMYAVHGEKSGERKFRKWLNSSDWGGFGKRWASSALLLAEWWMKLPKHVQDWLPNNIQGWSHKAITKLPVASAIGKNFMMALVARGKQSGKSCERALDSKNLKIDDYAVVVERDVWKGEIGKVVGVADDGIITLEFPTGETDKFAPEKLEHWSSEIPVLAVGDRITVTSDRDWAGYVGTVMSKHNPNGWWILLDAIAEKGSENKHLFKTSQIKNLVLATESDWEEITTLYNLSESDQESVREQAQLLAASKTGEGKEPFVTVDDIKSVLNNFGFKAKNSGGGSGGGEEGSASDSSDDTESNSFNSLNGSNDSEKVYTIAEIEAMKAEWEKQIRTELLIGLKSELRSQVEREVASELNAAKNHAQQLATKYQETLKTLEASKEKINQVQQLENELEAIKAENERLKQFMADVAANPSRWEKTFTQEAEKAINTDLEAKYSPLVEKLEEMTQKVEQQNLELQQYRQSVDENKQLKQSVEALQQQLNRKQAEVVKFKQASVNSPEVETLTLELGEVLGEQAGWTGWTGRGYRNSNGDRFTGLDALKAFIADMRGAIAPQDEELVLEF
ncbi:MAG: DNA cytosine methyltransferase [Crinalium sp.]